MLNWYEAESLLALRREELRDWGARAEVLVPLTEAVPGAHNAYHRGPGALAAPPRALASALRWLADRLDRPAALTPEA